nr:hypothetical protein [Acidobacteriota bacterium]
EGGLLKLVNLLASNGDQFRDSNRYREALNNYAKAVLHGRVRPTHWLENLTGVLDKEKGRLEFRATLDEAFAERVRESEGDVPRVFFDIFGSELIASEHPSRSINALKQLLSTALRKRDARVLEWIAAMVEAHSRMFDHIDWTGSFKDQVHTAVMKETDATFASILMKLADALSVPITDYIVETYEETIRNLVDLWQKRSFSPLGLLGKMREKKITLSILDIGSNDLPGGEWKMITSEDFRPIAAALSKIEFLVNATNDREAIERQLLAILEGYFNKEVEKLSGS